MSKQRLVIIFIVLIAVFALLFIYFKFNNQSLLVGKTSSVTTPSPSQNQAPDFTPFAKGWSKHGFGIVINADGTGEAGWRTYKWCSDDPTPPCDSMEGNNIISGGKAIIKLSSVNDGTASGQVISSSEPDVLMVAPFTLTILKYGMLELDQGKSKLPLCGPDFANLAPESVLKSAPCGA